MSRKKVLSAEELWALSRALNLSEEILGAGCPHVGCGIPQEFKAIGHLLEAARAGPGIGVELSLLGREQATQTPTPYMATGYSQSGVLSTSPIMTNRGPFVAVALSIIAACNLR